LEQSKMGLGISNEEMKRRTKLKYPFLKWFIKLNGKQLLHIVTSTK
jgi:hypothetical protein